MIAAIKNLPDMPARIATTELLEKAREEAISVLSRSSLASTDISHMQELAEESRLEKMKSKGLQKFEKYKLQILHLDRQPARGLHRWRGALAA